MIAKAHHIREDLGSSNEIFDEAAYRRLIEGESLAQVQADLERCVNAAQGRAVMEADRTTDTSGERGDAAVQLKALAAEIDLDPESLRDTLEAAMAIHAGRPQLDCMDQGSTCKVLNPSLPGWSEVIDDSLRRGTGQGSRGPIPRLAFSPEPFVQEVGDRVVFCPRADVILMHLSHPMFQRALTALTRRRFPGTSEAVSRWTVRLGAVPEGAEALVLLSIEELAINELRGTFHHWVRTLVFPILKGRLGPPLTHRPALEMRYAEATSRNEDQERARELIEDVEPDLKRYLAEHTARLTTSLRRQLEDVGKAARAGGGAVSQPPGGSLQSHCREHAGQART